MLNHIVIMGRLTRDPELRRTGSGIAVCNFTVAVDQDYSGKDGGEKTVDFIDCVAWRQTGEFVSKYFTKGRMIVVSGRLTINGYTDKEGNKRRKAEVVANSCYFGDSKRDNDSASTGGYTGNSYGGYGDFYAAPAQDSHSAGAPQDFSYPYPGKAPDYALLEDDDEQLPFFL